MNSALIVGVMTVVSLASTAAAPTSVSSPLPTQGHGLTQETTRDYALHWANSFLLSSLFLEEFRTVSSTLEEREQKAFFTTGEGRALWIRAAIAVSTAERKDHILAGIQTGKRDLVAAFAHFSEYKDKAAPTSLNAALTTLIPSPAPDQTKRGPLSHLLDLVETTWPDSSWQRNSWHSWRDSFEQGSPTCPLQTKDVVAYANHQKTLLKSSAGGSPRELLTPLFKWELPKIRCLVFAMMAANHQFKKELGFDPVHLLRAMAQTSCPYFEDVSIKIMYTLRLFQRQNYAETLRSLLSLRDQDESYRLAYEIVQRIYSIRQKGRGEVALQGI